MANNNELLRQALSMLDRIIYVQIYSQVTDPLASRQSDTSSSRARGPTGSEAGVSDRAPVALQSGLLSARYTATYLYGLSRILAPRSRCTAPRPFTYS